MNALPQGFSAFKIKDLFYLSKKILELCTAPTLSFIYNNNLETYLNFYFLLLLLLPPFLLFCIFSFLHMDKYSFLQISYQSLMDHTLRNTALDILTRESISVILLQENSKSSSVVFITTRSSAKYSRKRGKNS